VDGERGFVAGLCVGQQWSGDAARGIEPWRDTGIEITGPVLGQHQRAFAGTWALAGEPLPAEEPALPDRAPTSDGAWIRIVASRPGTAPVLLEPDLA
jgi:cardiolipin synthase